MIVLTFQFADQQELQSFVASLKHSAPAPVVAQAEAAVEAAAAPAPQTTSETATETTRKRGRPRKTESAAPAPVAAASGDQTSAPSVPKDEPAQQTLTVDDARTALQELVTSQGMDKGFEILGLFGAARVGELKAEDYAAFVAACKEA